MDMLSNSLERGMLGSQVEASFKKVANEIFPLLKSNQSSYEKLGGYPGRFLVAAPALRPRELVRSSTCCASFWVLSVWVFIFKCLLFLLVET